MNVKNNRLFGAIVPTGANGGFTLIELLVAIVIIGLLAAIALPSYLNQAAKARSSEAKSILGSINRSQQSYRWENNTFASSLSNLDVKVNGSFYTFAVGNASSSSATALAQNSQSGLKIASSGVNQTGDTFSQIVCETLSTQLINTTPTDPSVGVLPLSCPGGYVNIR